MRRRFLYWLTGFLPCRLIKVGDQPYLERYYVGRLFGVTFYLHRFISADGDRDVHNHPWRLSAALVLAGGYREERVTQITPDGWHSKERDLYLPKINIITGSRFHRIMETQPETWTLFMHGKRISTSTKAWGFLQKTADGLRLFNPYNLDESIGWWKRLPNGNTSGREPYAG